MGVSEMNKLYYAVVGSLIMCCLWLSFSTFFTDKIALINIIFLYTFGTISGCLIGFLYFDSRLQTEEEWSNKKIESLEKKYYETDQNRLAYIHKLQTDKTLLEKEMVKLQKDVVDNLGLNDVSEKDIAFGGTD
jgi:hypothetical protein